MPEAPRQLRVLCCGVIAVLVLGYTTINHWSAQQQQAGLTRRDIVTHISGQVLAAAAAGTHSNRLEENESSGRPLEITDVLFFNRVPKTGSEMLVLLLQWLQGYNTFRHFRLKNSVKRHLTHTQQRQLAYEVKDRLQAAADVGRVSFDRHVYFTNFTALGVNMPLYLNLIRDPVEKMASRFYYARVTPPPGAVTPAGYHPPPESPYSTLEECVANRGTQCTFITGYHYDLTIPYFCGHHQFCRELNSEAALRQAQQNVEEWYPVVGVLEDINSTLTVLHHHLPQFFYGVTDIYYNELLAPHHNKNWNRPKTTPQVEEVLKKNLTLEYEFYNFIRQRLNLQYEQIQKPQH